MQGKVGDKENRCFHGLAPTYQRAQEGPKQRLEDNLAELHKIASIGTVAELINLTGKRGVVDPQILFIVKPAMALILVKDMLLSSLMVKHFAVG